MSFGFFDHNEFSQPTSPSGALIVVPHLDEPDELDLSTAVATNELATWRPILSDSHQVVLYNSGSHALTVRPHASTPDLISTCPYCHRPLDLMREEPSQFEGTPHTRASNYFQLLEIANETSSRSSSPRRTGSGLSGTSSRSHSATNIRLDAMAEGYFNAFFKEEYRLGMGANGSVFLCQHVLDGNLLGHFAVKKIAVGQSHSYLLKILREVRLLEQLHHPNIITYHHAWLETYQFSSFGPKVPTLFVLMQWAEGGSLDDFIDARLGRPRGNTFYSNSNSISSTGLDNIRSRSDRIRAFRKARVQPQEERERRRAERARGIRTAVHLLSAEEIKKLFSDVVSGLSFLHDRSILHLDLKPGNVLLTWDSDALIPRAMLSDFGTSRDMIQPARNRSGNTGTLEYTAPESLPSPQTGLLSQIDSKADMWSLGMILHMLLFFRLPYQFSSDSNGQSNDVGNLDRLEKEVLEYQGFKRTTSLSITFGGRGLPLAYLILLESLLNRLPKKRPSSEQVMRAIREGNLDPIPMNVGEDIGEGTLVHRKASPTDANPSETHSLEPQLEHEYGHGDDNNVSSDLGAGFKEEHALLTLPESSPPPQFTAMVRFIQSFLYIWSDFRQWAAPLRPIIVRGLKSLLLVIKILMLLSICPDSRPEPVFACFILGVAVSDTWSEDLWITVLLAVLHVVILRLHCPNSKCCV